MKPPLLARLFGHKDFTHPKGTVLTWRGKSWFQGWCSTKWVPAIQLGSEE